jgi:hypothetical protein
VSRHRQILLILKAAKGCKRFGFATKNVR